MATYGKTTMTTYKGTSDEVLVLCGDNEINEYFLNTSSPPQAHTSSASGISLTRTQRSHSTCSVKRRPWKAPRSGTST